MKPSFNKLEKCHQLSRNREERWSGVQTYVFTIHKDSRKSLSQIRKEYMEKQAMEITDDL